MHSHESNAAALIIEVIGRLADRLRSAGQIAHGWPTSKLDDVRDLAIELCGRPPVSMDEHLISAARFFRAFLGEAAIKDLAVALDDAADRPESLLAVQCYLLSLWSFTMCKSVADKLAARFN